jgi:hypothetical protein
MRNIHILPTDKPSRLIIYSTLLNEFRLLNEPYDDWKHKRNIYITSDEEIKEGDWYLDKFGAIYKRRPVERNRLMPCDGNWVKKIILTTDQDLIKDGVQAIDDEFLEWFVKNPSCEKVEIEELCGGCGSNDGDCWRSKECNEGYYKNKYKIIFPKEELAKTQIDWSGFPKSTQEQVGFTELNIIDDWLEENGNPEIAKQVEEEAEELCKKQTFSEEEVLEFFIEGYKQRAESSNLIFDDASRMYAVALFEQFKKK